VLLLLLVIVIEPMPLRISFVGDPPRAVAFGHAASRFASVVDSMTMTSTSTSTRNHLLNDVDAL
jgi:hypothetical protein